MHWIKPAADEAAAANQVRTGLVQLQIGKDLPTNTHHPPEHEGAKCKQEEPCTARNKLLYTWESLHGFCSIARKLCSLVSLWVPGASAFLFELYLEAKIPQKKKIISIYEVFFQVKAVKLEASANHFYSKVRIPIAKMVRLSVCEITFIWRSNLMLRRKANNYSNLILQCKYIHAFFCLLMAKTIFTYAYKSYHMFN